MINFTLKRAIAVAMLAGASVGANAASTSLGTVNFGAPTSFHGTIDPGVATFNDIFNFNPATPNFGTGATVVNIPLTVPGVGGGLTWNTILSTMTLMLSSELIVRTALELMESKGPVMMRNWSRPQLAQVNLSV